jgi:hypothetical protein
VALAPRAISLHPSAASKEVWLRFRGLPIARWDEGRVFFGIDERRDVLEVVRVGLAESWRRGVRVVMRQ